MLNIDFTPGSIIWNEFTFDINIPLHKDNLSEDMLYIRYPHEIMLDVGWIEGINSFVVKIIHGHTPEAWALPLFKRRCQTISALQIILKQYSDYIRVLLAQKTFGNIDFFPGSVSLDLFDFDPIIPLDNTNPYLQEEMFEVMYDQDMQIQVQWQKELSTFMVIITQGKYPENLNNVLQQKECKTLEAIKETLKEYVAIIQEKLNSSE